MRSHDEGMRALILAIAVLLTSTLLARPASADDENTRYGAIAWSPSTGATGSTSHYISKGLAESGATINCGQNDCRVMISGADDYPMALAAARDGRVFTNWNNNWPDLRDNLLADCRAYSGSTCRIVAALPLS